MPVFNDTDREHYFDMSSAEMASAQARTQGLGVFQALELGYFKSKRQFFNFQAIDVQADLRHIAYFSDRRLGGDMIDKPVIERALALMARRDAIENQALS